MKKIYAVILISVLSLTTFGTYAQEDGNRDANGKVVRGPYLTNKFFDNWFVGAGAGASIYIGGFNDDFGSRVRPTIDVNFGKWFSPSFGARFDFNLTPTHHEQPYGTSYEFTYWNLHADFLWNLSNTFGGYKETRVYQLIPFIGGGFAQNSSGDIVGASYGFNLNVGFINKFRISNRIDLNLEFIATGCKQTFDQIRQCESRVSVDVPMSIVAGITFKLGKTNFQRASSVTVPVSDGSLEKEYEQFKKDLADAQNTNKNLQMQLAELNEKLAQAGAQKVIVKEKQTTFVTTFFKIGTSTLPETELADLEVYMDCVNQLVNKDGEKKFHIVGAADKATGNKEINYKLSKERAEYIKNILINKYGVKESNIITTYSGDENNRFDVPYLNRTATTFVTVE